MLNPNLAAIQQNLLSRMLPLSRPQVQVYRMGESHPPGFEGYSPKWECVTLNLAGKATQQMRIGLERGFTLIAIASNSTAGTGWDFRAQIYDQGAKCKLADRGVNAFNLGGAMSATGTDPFFLREPYTFGGDKPTALLNVQNQNAGANSIQVVLYGVCLRKDQVLP